MKKECVSLVLTKEELSYLTQLVDLDVEDLKWFTDEKKCPHYSMIIELKNKLYSNL